MASISAEPPPISSYVEQVIACWLQEDAGPGGQFMEFILYGEQIEELRQWCERNTSAGHGSFLAEPVHGTKNEWIVRLNPAAEEI